jgi:uncharacterized secreted protein with C-terminal beta-propeller domain
MRKWLALPLAAALAALGVAAAASTSPAAPQAGKRLQAFGSCGALLQHLKRQARPLVGPYGLGSAGASGPSIVAAPEQSRAADSGAAKGVAGIDFSGTNVQEEGVDEPDLVKTDGARLFVVNGAVLRALDTSSGRPMLTDSLRLPNGWGHELLLRGDRLLVLTRGGGWIEPAPGLARSLIAPISSDTTLTEVDVRDERNLRVVRTAKLDGDYVSARLTGGTGRVVLSSPLGQELKLARPTGEGQTALDAAADRNRRVVARSGLRAWLPRTVVRTKGRPASESRALVQCRNVHRPASFSGLGLLTVLTLDLDRGLETIDSDAIVADGRIVYASRDRLYVATERWADRPETQGGAVDDGVTTAIHAFDISDPRRTRYRASGRVTGVLLNQWSLSEHRGVLRVASTDTPAWWNPGSQRETESHVTTLREQGGELTAVGRVGGLGKGERIYAVRFMGDTGYVVTFRQVDPLYTLDLANPARPAVLGELKIPGYSAYLHPLGDELLLGIGQNASNEGRILGTQLSIFDISNLRRPARLHTVSLPRGYSEAEGDHHAFLYWPQSRLAVIPQQTWQDEKGAGETFAGAIGYSLSRTRGIDRVGRVEHPARGGQAWPVRRSLVIRGAVYTVSDAGVLASSLAGLAPLGFAAFPAQP